MDVGRIGNTGRITGGPAKPDRKGTARRDGADKSERVAISGEAKQAEGVLPYVRVVRQLPDIRQDRVDEVQRKIDSGSYPDDNDIRETAKRLLSG